MAIQTFITITHDKESLGDLQAVLSNTPTSDPKLEARLLANFIDQVANGSRNASIDVQVNNGNAVAASGTATLTGVQAGDILLVNGIAFTAVASGAAGNQFNIGGSDSITATNLSSAINASASAGISGIITSSAASNVVTVTTVKTGAFGNDYDIEGRGSGAIVVGGAGAQASGTLTCNNAGAAGDSVTINGVAFTAVASGASGNQYNVGGSASATAANIVTAVNGSVAAGVLGYVFASAVGAVVTVRATRVGTFGNEFTIAAGQASVTASGARLTGGTDSAVVNFSGGTDPLPNTYKFGL